MHDAYRNPEPAEPVVIDCSTCSIRGRGCDDCVISVLIGVPEDLEPVEAQAIDVLADSGLIPPLRLVTNRHR